MALRGFSKFEQMFRAKLASDAPLQVLNTMRAIPRNTTQYQQYQFCLRRPSSGSQGKEGEGGIEQRRGEDKRVKSSMEVFFNNVSVKVAVKKS